MRYLARRAVFAVFLVLVVSSGALLFGHLAPGDFASELAAGGANVETLARERARYNLDRPFLEQYAGWLSRAARLDFGESLYFRRPVRDLVVERAGNTALLGLTALALATLAGIPLGIVAGSRARGWLPTLIRAASLVCLSLPPLLTSLLLVFLAARTGWLPIGGMTSVDASSAGWAAWFADVVWHLPLPAFALALPLGATLERLQAQAMAETLQEPFVLAAAARGIPRRRIVWRHALRASMRPVLSVYGLVVGSLLGGSFIVEIVTAWPGLGRLMFDALRARDPYLVAGCAAAGAAFLALATLASDLALALVDPRVRTEASRA